MQVAQAQGLGGALRPRYTEKYINREMANFGPWRGNSHEVPSINPCARIFFFIPYGLYYIGGHIVIIYIYPYFDGTPLTLLY
jgi:hypothetical protein